MSGTRVYQFDELQTKVAATLRSRGVDNIVAENVSTGLAWASLRGIDSHGVRLLPHYLKGIEGGRINPHPEPTFDLVGASTGVVDGDHCFGHHAGSLAMTHATDLAAQTGIGAVAVKNSSHCGALSFFGNIATDNDMIGMVFTHATSRVRSANGIRPFFGNNPVCFMAPMLDEDPFCYDSATTTTTFNSIRHAEEQGRFLPAGVAADIGGAETTDPARATQLIPIGDYKGFGLSMVVDILCGLLTTMPTGDSVSQMFDEDFTKKRHLGHFFIAIDISRFLSPFAFKASLTSLAVRVRAEPAIDADQPVMVPGDPEKAIELQRREYGITVDDAITQLLE